MKRYLLDTGPLAALFFNRQWAVSLVDPWIRNQEAATSIVVYGEVIEYLRGYPDFPRRQTQLRRLLRQVTPYYLSYAIAERYADIRRRLRPPYGPGLIGDMDTLIAATALERNLTVVTADRHFAPVPDLKVLFVTL